MSEHINFTYTNESLVPAAGLGLASIGSMFFTECKNGVLSGRNGPPRPSAAGHPRQSPVPLSGRLGQARGWLAEQPPGRASSVRDAAAGPAMRSTGKPSVARAMHRVRHSPSQRRLGGSSLRVPRVILGDDSDSA
jgi:hypothetical protein